MAIFNEYLTGNDRVLAIEDAKLDNEYIKLSTLFEMTNLQLAQMQRDAEMKVFEEAGTYDDLTFLYQEADAEVSGQRQNIFQKIIAWFGNIFKVIGNKIKSIFGVKEDVEVEVPVEVIEKTSAVEKSYNEMQNGMAKLRNGDWSGAFNILNAVKIPAAIAGGAVAAGFAVKKLKKNECDALTQRLKKVKQGFENMWNGISSKLTGITDANQQSDAQKSLNPIQKILSVINSIISAIVSAVTGTVKGVKNTTNNNANNGTADNSTNNGNNNVNDNGSKKEKSPEEQQKIDNDKTAGLKNGVTIKRLGGFEYRIDQMTGRTVKIDDKGNETDVPDNQIPAPLVKLVHRAKAEGAMQEQNNADKKSLAQAKKSFKLPKGSIGGKVQVNPATHRMYYISDDGKTTELNKDNLKTVLPDRSANDKQMQKLRKKIVAYATESSEINYTELSELFTEAGIDFVFEDITFESIINEIETDGYIVESVDGIISIRELKTIEESVASNIFGTDINDEAFEESTKDAFDQEVEDLMKEFAAL